MDFAKGVYCPNCGMPILVLISDREDVIECPHCGHRFSIEEAKEWEEERNVKSTFEATIIRVRGKNVWFEADVDLHKARVLEKRIIYDNDEVTIKDLEDIVLENADYITFDADMSVYVYGKKVSDASDLESLGVDPRTFLPKLIKKIWNDLEEIATFSMIKEYKIDSVNVVVVFDEAMMPNIEYISDVVVMPINKEVKEIKKYEVDFLPPVGSLRKTFIEIVFHDGSNIVLEVSGFDYAIYEFANKDITSKLPIIDDIENVVKKYEVSKDKIVEFYAGGE